MQIELIIQAKLLEVASQGPGEAGAQHPLILERRQESRSPHLSWALRMPRWPTSRTQGVADSVLPGQEVGAQGAIPGGKGPQVVTHWPCPATIYLIWYRLRASSWKSLEEGVSTLSQGAEAPALISYGEKPLYLRTAPPPTGWGFQDTWPRC